MDSLMAPHVCVSEFEYSSWRHCMFRGFSVLGFHPHRCSQLFLDSFFRIRTLHLLWICLLLNAGQPLHISCCARFLIYSGLQATFTYFFGGLAWLLLYPNAQVEWGEFGLSCIFVQCCLCTTSGLHVCAILPLRCWQLHVQLPSLSVPDVVVPDSWTTK